MAHYGVYRGTLMNRADPTMKGRVQVSVPAIMGGASTWAAPCRDYGSATTPPVGTTVWVMFEGGNPSNPVWIGCMT